MSPEEYQQRAAELGINRGALLAGFAFELPSIVMANKQQNVFKKNRGPIIKPPAPDLTHLNPSTHTNGKRGGSVKKNASNLGAARGRVRPV